MKKKIYSIVLFLVLSSFLSVVNAQVAKIGNIEYNSIQDAIDNAYSNDIIYIYEGIHEENLVVDKEITLASLFHVDGKNSHIQNTVLSGNNIAPLINTAYKVTLIGITLTNGFADVNGKGAVVNSTSITNNMSIKISNCVIDGNHISNNASLLGSTEFINTNHFIVENSIIKNNSGVGACFLSTSRSCELNNNEIFSNTTTTIFHSSNNFSVSPNTYVAFNNNVIYNNTCSSVILTQNQNVKLNHNTITNNNVSRDVIVSGITHSEFEKIYFEMLNTIIWDNSFSIISVLSANEVKIENCVIDGAQNSIETVNCENVSQVVYSVNPKFVNASENNFHLQNLSPCIGFASESEITKDIEGNIRSSIETNETFPDIGAYENVYVKEYKAYYKGEFYTSIQNAVDNLNYDSDYEWGRIYIMHGIHEENISINDKRVLIYPFYYNTGIINRGNHLTLPSKINNKVVLDGNSSGSVLSITGYDAHVQIEGLTIQNGYSENGGGIYVKKVAGFDLSYCALKNNVANLGGAIYLERVDMSLSSLGPKISTCEFENNSSGIYVYATSKKSIFENLKFQNTTYTGNNYIGAISIINCENVYVSNTDLLDHSQSTLIYVDASQKIYFNNLNIYNNETYVPIFFRNSENISFTNSIIQNNIFGSVFSLKNFGKLSSPELFVFSNLLITDNRLYGHVIDASSQNISILYSTFSDNTYNSEDAQAIYFNGSDGDVLNCKNSIFRDNLLNNIVLNGYNSTLNINHTNIKNGKDGILTWGEHVVNYDMHTNISEDPLFGNEYKLTNTSPCVGAGVSTNLELYDLAGVKRNKIDENVPTDMGAYENFIDNILYAAKNITKGEVYYVTIQEAIDKASNGDEILLMPKNHVGFIDLGEKDLTIYSYYHIDGNKEWIEKTIIDGNNTTKLMSASGKDVKFIGVTFKNGYANESFDRVSCIDIGSNTATSSLFKAYYTFDNCVFNYNQSINQSIFYCSDGSITMNDCEFSNNESYNSIIHLGIRGEIDIDRTTIYSNTCRFIFGFENSCIVTKYSTIKNSLVYENTANTGIACGGNHRLLINHTTFSKNIISEDGNLLNSFILPERSQSFILRNSILWNNTNNTVLLQGNDYHKSINNCIVSGGMASIINNATNFSINEIYNENPQFIDIDNFDFRLTSSSPAIDIGYVWDENTEYDYVNNSRDLNYPDIGCYAYNESLRFFALNNTDNNSVSIENKDFLSVFPIPMKNKLNIIGDLYHYAEFYNMSGSICLTSNNKIIDVSSLLSGQYIIKIFKTDKSIESFFVVKE